MNNLDLRPLSMGEVLDRTFTLYRRHFLLFVGLAGIPQVPALALNLGLGLAAGILPLLIAVVLLLIAAMLLAYLYSQGGSVLAVSKLYLGRPTTITESLNQVTPQLGYLFGALLLNALAVVAGFIFLIVPGIYVAWSF